MWQKIYLKDECPRIGSGMRLVRILSRGWKWVRIESRDGTRARLRLNTWNEIERGSVAYEKRNKSQQSQIQK